MGISEIKERIKQESEWKRVRVRGEWMKEMRKIFHCKREFQSNGPSHLQSHHSCCWFFSSFSFSFCGCCCFSRRYNLCVWKSMYRPQRRMQVNWLYRLFDYCHIRYDCPEICEEFFEFIQSEIPLAIYSQQIHHLYCSFVVPAAVANAVMDLFILLFYFILFLEVFILVCYLWKQRCNQIKFFMCMNMRNKNKTI